MYCPKCGANNLEGQTFCGSCGSPLSSGTSAYVEPQDHYQKEERTNTAPVSGSYTAPQGNFYTGGTVRPKSYLTESILVTIISTLCCSSIISLVLGIIAIVKASNVDTYFNMGNVSEAVQNSDSAKKLTIWAAVIAAVWGIVFYIFIFTIGLLGSIIENL
ncbi:MAG: CD225/dispanin family protein [Tannerella sp.]|jgi:uncharacterized membrane protein YvbJ|nr:CD225/dispanin family protein [Tannerella sp.]